MAFNEHVLSVEVVSIFMLNFYLDFWHDTVSQYFFIDYDEFARNVLADFCHYQLNAMVFFYLHLFFYA
jgi:hypothetical protein